MGMRAYPAMSPTGPSVTTMSIIPPHAAGVRSATPLGIDGEYPPRTRSFRSIATGITLPRGRRCREPSHPKRGAGPILHTPRTVPASAAFARRARLDPRALARPANRGILLDLTVFVLNLLVTRKLARMFLRAVHAASAGSAVAR